MTILIKKEVIFYGEKSKNQLHCDKLQIQQESRTRMFTRANYSDTNTRMYNKTTRRIYVFKLPL